MPKRTEHTWREKTEDGEERTLRGSRIAGQWKVSFKLEGEEFWDHRDPIPEEELRQLRDVLWRNAQRRRVPWEHVLEIDKLLGDDES